MRSLGWPPWPTADLIAWLSEAMSCAAESTSPVGPVSSPYSVWAWVRTEVRSLRSVWMRSLSSWAWLTSAWRVAGDSGWLDRSSHELQNLARTWPMPLSLGSESESSAWPSSDAVASFWPKAMFCARYCRSANWSRTRLKLSTSTPEPSIAMAPLPVTPEMLSGSAACSTACWRL